MNAQLSRLTNIIVFYWWFRAKSEIARGVQFSTMVSSSYNVLSEIKYSLPFSFNLH